MRRFVREPVNGFTHLAGAILSFIGLIAMTIKATANSGSALSIAAVIIFGISMILLYSASATYHMVLAKKNVLNFLRKLDHSMIYLLIAGTYTPFCLIALNGIIGWTLLVLIFTLAICGIVFKMVWFKSPRWVSTALYIAMGWLVIFAFAPLANSIPTAGLVFLILGGVIYTIGGIIYGAKPKFLESKYMGFHEIFHIFILLGSLAHFTSVYVYIL